MKKLTIYRHGEYDNKRQLLPRSAYELYSQAKKLKEELGRAEVIYTSNVSRALQTAEVIQLVMQATEFKRRPQLADYNATLMRPFAEEFVAEAALCYDKIEHILWVTHDPNIYALLRKDIYMGESVTLEADSWRRIFDENARKVTTPMSRLELRFKDGAKVMQSLRAFYSDDCTPEEHLIVDERLSALQQK